MSNNFPSKSLQQELKIRLTLLVIVPLIFSALYFSFNSYQQALELAQDDVERHADSIALDLQNELTKQTYSFSSFSNDPVLGEIAINILYSQYAFKKLNDIVEENSVIEAAFISDGSEFIIEGYPLATLKFKDPIITLSAKKLINANEKKLTPKVIYLTDIPNELIAQNKGALLIAFPLRKQLPSLIQPYQTTAVLYLMLSPDVVLKTAQLADYTDISVIINNSLFYQKKQSNNKPTLTASRQVLFEANDGIDLHIQISHLTSLYTQKIHQSTLITLAIIVIIFILLIIMLNIITKGISRPLKSLEALSLRFTSGDYTTSKEHFRYSELAHLQQSLNQMATTIVEQISNLNIAKKRAEQSEEIKARFLANMSHEIRTPLNGITGLLKMIETEPLSPNQKIWLHDANHSSDLLLHVVNDILDFSKIEQGKVTLDIIDSNLSDIFNSLKAIANTLIKDKEIKFSVNSTLQHHYWKIDPTRLMQILVNLISNAIKFTDAGEVTLVCNSRVDAKNKTRLHFEIQDSGIGIEAEKLDDLFQSFKQADISTTRKFGGTGLGLSISKNLVQLMGGEIQVTSEFGQGTCFSFDIQAKQGIKSQPKKQSTEVPQFPASKILIVEDNKINQTIIKHILMTTKAQLAIAENGIEAIASTQKFQPDLILMDVQMPEMDGIEATIQIRKDGFTGPIIMQTANVMEKEVQDYLAKGATAHLAKPISAEALYQQLNLYLI